MNEMWKKEEFLIANGLSQLPNASMTNDLSPYDYFDGGSDTSLDISFSEATGRRPRPRRRPKKRTGEKTGFEKAMSYTPLGMAKEGIDKFNSPESKARRDANRKKRGQKKQVEAQKQEQAIADVNKNSEADAKLLAQITQTPATPTNTNETPKKGMSKGTKTALIIGSVAVLGIVGFMLYKKFKNKGL